VDELNCEEVTWNTLVNIPQYKWFMIRNCTNVSKPINLEIIDLDYVDNGRKGQHPMIQSLNKTVH
jgi:hypothetical protein